MAVKEHVGARDFSLTTVLWRSMFTDTDEFDRGGKPSIMRALAARLIRLLF